MRACRERGGVHPGTLGRALVWQQRRAFEDLQAASFDMGREAMDLRRDRPTHLFILEANHWRSL